MFFSGFVSSSKAAGGPPALTVALNSATEVSETSATLNAVVNPRGYETAISFVVSKNADLADSTEHVGKQSPLRGNSSIVVSVKLSTLEPKTRYYYQVIAVNSNAIVKSPVREVETL
jgi:phosphodiesterase/alkaline phosphatase D-like protein